jgi:type II secretory pathway pseudopilin PulG
MLKINNFRATGSKRTVGFTLIETLVVLALMVTVIASALAAMVQMQISSARAGEVNAAMAIVEAKAQDIRAVYYNPPVYPFTAGTVYVTNNDSIDLDTAGVKFKVPGTVISKIENAGSLGHLITVTATFQTPRLAMTQTVQTVVNKFTGGQQQ